MLNQALLADLSVELDALEEDRGVIAYALRREARSLGFSGTLHLESVAEATELFRRRVLQLNQRLQTLSREAGVPGNDAAQISLPAIGHRLQELRSRLPVRKLLAEVQRLQGDLDPADREAVRQSAAELETAAADRAAEIPDSEALEQHPLTALLRLVNRGSELSDAEWDRDHSLTRTAFGVGVASAVARGRLVLAPADSKPEIQPETP